jgi:hypothetical protein
MVPGKSDLTNYKIEELQAWRGEVRADLQELREKINALDRKNDKGFQDLNLKLKGISDFMKNYKECDAPRIDRLEKGFIGTMIMLLLTLAGLVGEIVWGHVKPGG